MNALNGSTSKINFSEWIMACSLIARLVAHPTLVYSLSNGHSLNY